MANELSIIQKDITDTVSSKVKELQNDGLQLPPNYNASNALKSAFFAIKEVKIKGGANYLETHANNSKAKESIANALLDMVVQGLSPSKTQVYFIAYGERLTMTRSYFGTQAVLLRLSNVQEVWAEVVHKGDKFQIGSEKGRTVVTEFIPSFENLDNELIAAFAVIKKKNGEEIFTVMTKKQIDTAWSKTKTGGGVQREFPEEMAKRTVINRAAKTFINTSDDSDLLTDAIKRTTSEEYDNDKKDVTPKPAQAKALEEQFQSKQNPVIDFEENEVSDVENETTEDTVQDFDAMEETPDFSREEGASDDKEGDWPF